MLPLAEPTQMPASRVLQSPPVCSELHALCNHRLGRLAHSTRPTPESDRHSQTSRPHLSHMLLGADIARGLSTPPLPDSASIPNCELPVLARAAAQASDRDPSMNRKSQASVLCRAFL